MSVSNRARCLLGAFSISLTIVVYTNISNCVLDCYTRIRNLTLGHDKMNQLRQLILATMAVLLICSLTSCGKNADVAAPPSADLSVAKNYSGVWKTSYGDVYFPKTTTKEVRGAFWSYPDSNGKADNGRIIATISGKRLDGYWVEDSGDTPCETERDGSYNWGPVHFEANEDFSVISGAWGFCDQLPEGDDAGWVGVRD